jgi:hypothetical protein
MAARFFGSLVAFCGGALRLAAGMGYDSAARRLQVRKFSCNARACPCGRWGGLGNYHHSVRSFSDKTSLPEWARPVLDGLMGLNMDLSMDAIAIRLGMWDWGKRFDYQYFGVPYNNFWAWFWVVFSFSASLRLLSKLPGFWGRWFSPAGAIICGTTGVLITNELITNIPNDLIHYATIIAVLVSALLLILALRPEISIRSQAAFVFLVPLGFHAYFLIAGLVSSVILDPLFLLVVSIVMSIISLGLNRDALNYWYRSNRESKIEKAGN